MSEATSSAIFIPWAQTDWQLAGRHASKTPIAINDHGRQQIEAWSRLMENHTLSAVHCPESGPGAETAQQIGSVLNTKLRKTALFDEIGLGLWEGLSPDELKKRFGRSYKQWRDDPASVCPPEGEQLGAAVERLIGEIHKQARKRAGECFGVVLGPLSFAAVRCKLEGRPYSNFWEVPFDQPVRYFIDPEEDTATLTIVSGIAG